VTSADQLGGEFTASGVRCKHEPVEINLVQKLASFQCDACTHPDALKAGMVRSVRIEAGTPESGLHRIDFHSAHEAAAVPLETSD
jgi:hypothetical protein